MKDVIVVSKAKFRETVEKFGIGPGVAYISIEATPECARYWLESEKGDGDNEHYLPDLPNVCNVNFDDLTRDIVWKGHQFKAINEEQATRILDFIEDHLGCQLIIHCKAGQSRSQGVRRFILDMYPNDYSGEITGTTPNIEVLSKLKQAYFKKHGEYE